MAPLAAAVPFLKLGILFVKTVAKPVASALKKRAQDPGMLRNMCASIGQMQHRQSKTVSIWLAGHRRVKIKPLEEEKAITAGADFVGESFIYGVGALGILYEVQYNSAKSARKEAAAHARATAERAELDARITQVEEALQRIEREVCAQRAAPPTEPAPLSSKWSWLSGRLSSTQALLQSNFVNAWRGEAGAR